jgi:16S rRNA (adenine1518-N6/adenine1519-N6)-dimethyltransferase
MGNMIANVKNTLDILNKYGIRPKKKLGQNFLIDVNVLRKIITAANVGPEDGVIEIGPGIGALTEGLMAAAKKVVAYEIDQRFIEILENELPRRDNLKIAAKDFLKADLDEDLEWLTDCARILVVSNLPYYITTPIIFRLLKSVLQASEFYLMVQKEVGTRLTAGPERKEYGALSVYMKYKTDAEILFSVSPNCFYPRPEVESIMIAIKRKTASLPVQSEEKFLEFIKLIFSRKRKTLLNNVSDAYGFDKEQLRSNFSAKGLNEKSRAEELEVQKIRDLYVLLFESPNP